MRFGAKDYGTAKDYGNDPSCLAVKPNLYHKFSLNILRHVEGTTQKQRPEFGSDKASHVN